MKVCAVTAQPGQTKELQSVQLERSLHSSTRQGVIFEDDDRIQGQKELSVPLHSAVKPDDVGDPIFAGGWSILSRVELHVHFTLLFIYFPLFEVLACAGRTKET